MLDFVNPFTLKEGFDAFNVLRAELGDLSQDMSFLGALRRAFLPLPLLDRRRSTSRDLFPRLDRRPHPVLAGKRVGLVASGGGGALVTLCGIKRALEEAEVEIAAISVCSGSAIWGSMIAAGLSAEQMVDLSLGWTAADLVEINWSGIAGIPWNLGKGFLGIGRTDPLERTLERIYHGVTLGRTPIPYYAIVLNIDTNELGYVGPHNMPDVRLASMVRVAVALPLFVEPFRLGDHLYVDGGVVDIFPVEPLLRYEELDFIIGVNVIMPSRFQGEDITGWPGRPLSLLEPSRQLHHVQWLELARRQLAAAEDRMLLLEPLPFSELAGSRFWQLVIDGSRWPEFNVRAYEHARAELARLGQ
jgi:NTE family protein